MTVLEIGRFPQGMSETVELELISPFPLHTKGPSSYFRLNKHKVPPELYAVQRGKDLLAEIHADEDVLYASLDHASNCRIIVVVERDAVVRVAMRLRQISHRLNDERLQMAMGALDMLGHFS